MKNNKKINKTKNTHSKSKTSQKPNNQKLWGGRFAQATENIVDEFNASVSFDQTLAHEDIQGSIAHAKMLKKIGVLKDAELKKIIKGLQTIDNDIKHGNWQWDVALEDVHLNIESKLTDTIGALGGKLHTARSRNDQVATDLRLYCSKQSQCLIASLEKFQQCLVAKAKQYLNVFLPGYTHMQRAQPISLAHQLMAYVAMAERDIERLHDGLKRIQTLPLGSGALAGSTFALDRSYTAKELGLKRISENSLDAVSDRDFVIELLSNLSILQMHLSRLAEEWILWCSQEFQFIILPEGYCTGSSMMPQKINPDVLELIRGKTGRVYGNLMSLLTVMKGLPLAYNKDMQEDKEPLFDAIKTSLDCINILNQMIPLTEFNADKMQAALEEGFVLATDLADYLVTKGIPFREAHHYVGQIVRYCQDHQTSLEQLDLETYQSLCSVIEADVKDWLNIAKAVDRRSATGGTGRREIKKQIRKYEKKLKN